DALAHGVLPGIATAMLLGVSGIVGAAIGAAVMMGGVSVVSRRFRLSGDTAIGLLFVGSGGLLSDSHGRLLTAGSGLVVRGRCNRPIHV
ncbi:MAG: hypothetical protein EBZ65_08670, partial [Betaproteobacteria bacterium]|nr:hypothetical protein [Betaproteobacteria bacterium]